MAEPSSMDGFMRPPEEGGKKGGVRATGLKFGGFAPRKW